MMQDIFSRHPHPRGERAGDRQGHRRPFGIKVHVYADEMATARSGDHAPAGEIRRRPAESFLSDIHCREHRVK
jgi:hypothetical protein